MDTKEHLTIHLLQGNSRELIKLEPNEDEEISNKLDLLYEQFVAFNKHIKTELRKTTERKLFKDEQPKLLFLVKKYEELKADERINFFTNQYAILDKIFK